MRYPCLIQAPNIMKLPHGSSRRLSVVIKRGIALLESLSISSTSEKCLALPLTCPGCGSYSNMVNSENAGFYSLHRPRVKAYITAKEQGGAALHNDVSGNLTKSVHDPALRITSGVVADASAGLTGMSFTSM